MIVKTQIFLENIPEQVFVSDTGYEYNSNHHKCLNIQNSLQQPIGHTVFAYSISIAVLEIEILNYLFASRCLRSEISCFAG